MTERIAMMNTGNDGSGPLRVGGAIRRASATLRIFGDALDPDQVTKVLGRPPTTLYRKGDPVSPRVAGERKVGMWQLESALPATEDLSRQVLDLLSQLPGDPAVWETMAATFSVDVYCGIDVRLPNSGIELTSAAIAALAARKLSLQLDLYALPELEDESSV